jgi:hypothetical protein
LTDTTTDNIKKKLKEMMCDTSVTIVIISPNIKLSKWINWEIEYCLKEISRKGRTSHVNGLVGVIMKHNSSYDWFKYQCYNKDGCRNYSYNEDLVYDIIKKNRYNQNPPIYSCDICKSINSLTGSYVSYVEEDTFLKEPNYYIENAYSKSENDASGYDIVKIV